MFSLALPNRIAAAALAVAVGWFANAIQPARAGGVAPAYFDPDAGAPLAPLMFMELAPPPTDAREDKTDYAYGPITDSVSQNADAQNDSSWTGRNWVMVWANRARVPTGQPALPPNPITPAIVNSSRQNCAAEFSTVARANAATTAQVLYIAGAPPSVWQAPLVAAGMSPSGAVTWDQLNADPDAYFTRQSQDGSSRVTLDRMVIPQDVSTSAVGIAIDYEVHDGRASPEGEGFLDSLGATIRGYKLKAYLYTNPWESDVTALNGFTLAGMDQIKVSFDYISLFVWGAQNACDINSPGWNQAITFLKGASGKMNNGQFVLTIDLLNCSSADALAIYKQMNISHFAGYTLWPDGTTMGGTRLTGPNLILWTLLNG
jgi:hypothetical protein